MGEGWGRSVVDYDMSSGDGDGDGGGDGGGLGDDEDGGRIRVGKVGGGRSSVCITRSTRYYTEGAECRGKEKGRERKAKERNS
ncbi:hypothetical protein BU24DRAFT_428730 [Aaosphaeria arxii CBS 175.79]|uniref:Uncharacterized protein n=1 Tax=Aaosphaeria arxii CBS 175.79 TaxID=1450172 RepID=A0A6A5X829_9PLEO|nr:uncharacterized protein BU24DRAFT_428730 [Aaosphaeria arxii CBS 175.79]KAF2009195.1 hypothetical protein BU24DRAFT_428730 [Aaosphaeria arxii CBS 175.79]